MHLAWRVCRTTDPAVKIHSSDGSCDAAASPSDEWEPLPTHPTSETCSLMLDPGSAAEDSQQASVQVLRSRDNSLPSHRPVRIVCTGTTLFTHLCICVCTHLCTRARPHICPTCLYTCCLYKRLHACHTPVYIHVHTHIPRRRLYTALCTAFVRVCTHMPRHQRVYTRICAAVPWRKSIRHL